MPVDNDPVEHGELCATSLPTSFCRQAFQILPEASTPECRTLMIPLAVSSSTFMCPRGSLVIDNRLLSSLVPVDHRHISQRTKRS
jgi:hypothetical protein